MMIRPFSSAELESLLGVQTAALRDWRRWKVLEPTDGHKQGREWRYSLKDVLLIALVKIMNDEGLVLPLAMAIARLALPYVKASMPGSTVTSEFSKSVTIAAWNSGEGYRAAIVSSAEELERSPGLVLTVVRSPRLTIAATDALAQVYGVADRQDPQWLDRALMVKAGYVD